MAFTGSGMLENLPSEGVYEDIGAVPVGEKVEGPRVPRDLVLEEDYDDAWELQHGLEEEEEEEQEEGAPWSVAGAPLCAVLSFALALLYCAYVRGSAPSSTYI